MQRGSSVNFQPVTSALHAVSHADRTVAPQYLLPPDLSLGTIVVRDDRGAVAKTLDAKMALASRQAKAVKGYTPLWEGVINLRSPKAGEDVTAYKRECSQFLKSWVDNYETLTKHKVLRADVHLDEGRVDADTGEVLFNAHAHVICDKTNELGRVLKVNAPTLRKIQDFTSEITGLERGKNSLQTGRKHLGHQAYKYLAEQGRLETKAVLDVVKTKHAAFKDKAQKVVAQANETITAKDAEIAELKAQIEAQYKAHRAAMVASKTATQADYQRLKKERDEALVEAAKVPELEAQVIELENKLDAMTQDRDRYKTHAAETVEKGNTIITRLKTELAEAKESSTPTRGAEPGLTGAKAVTPSGLHGPRAIEQPKTALEPVISPSLGNSILKPKKTLVEALKASWDTFVDWIKSKGGKVEQVQDGKNYLGPVVQSDDLHAVQHTGRGVHVIHELEKLDRVPQEGVNINIRYTDGRGHVSGGPTQAPKMR